MDETFYQNLYAEGLISEDSLKKTKERLKNPLVFGAQGG